MAGPAHVVRLAALAVVVVTDAPRDELVQRRMQATVGVRDGTVEEPIACEPRAHGNRLDLVGPRDLARALVEGVEGPILAAGHDQRLRAAARRGDLEAE